MIIVHSKMCHANGSLRARQFCDLKIFANLVISSTIRMHSSLASAHRLRNITTRCDMIALRMIERKEPVTIQAIAKAARVQVSFAQDVIDDFED